MARDSKIGVLLLLLLALIFISSSQVCGSDQSGEYSGTGKYCDKGRDCHKGKRCDEGEDCDKGMYCDDGEDCDKGKYCEKGEDCDLECTKSPKHYLPRVCDLVCFLYCKKADYGYHTCSSKSTDSCTKSYGYTFLIKKFYFWNCICHRNKGDP